MLLQLSTTFAALVRVAACFPSSSRCTTRTAQSSLRCITRTPPSSSRQRATITLQAADDTAEPKQRKRDFFRMMSPQRCLSDDLCWVGSEEAVEAFMKTDIITLLPQSSLSDAGKTFVERNIAGAPVVSENGQLLGVLSRKDLLHKIAGRDSFKPVRHHHHLHHHHHHHTHNNTTLSADRQPHDALHGEHAEAAQAPGGHGCGNQTLATS